MAISQNPDIPERDMLDRDAGLSQKLHTAVIVHGVVPGLRGDYQNGGLQQVRELDAC